MMNVLFRVWASEPVLFVAFIRGVAIVIALIMRDYFNTQLKEELSIALYSLLELTTTLVQRSQVTPTGKLP